MKSSFLYNDPTVLSIKEVIYIMYSKENNYIILRFQIGGMTLMDRAIKTVCVCVNQSDVISISTKKRLCFVVNKMLHA